MMSTRTTVGGGLRRSSLTEVVQDKVQQEEERV